MRIYVAGIFIAFFAVYGILFWRLRDRRVGPAAIGTFYDMLEQEKQKAVEIIVDEKAEQTGT
jgi:hypothetical protein